MITIKLSTPWRHDFLKRTPEDKGVFGNYVFEIDNNCEECDFWIVWGNLKEKTRVKCPPENVIYITDETYAEKSFNQEFLEQFSAVIACRKDLYHPHIIYSHDLGIWHFNKSYDEVAALQPIENSKSISTVSSDLTWLPGHKKRFAFVNKLMGHYKSKMDFYGRGINPIEDKFDAIAPYQYSVAIENSYIKGYFTEKLFECFLTYTLPIYYGCPDLEEYFDERAFVRIDIDDLQGAINIIDEVIKQNLYQGRLNYLKEARELYLNRYYFFPSLINIIQDRSFVRNGKKKTNILCPEESFLLTPLEKVYYKVKSYI